MIIAQHIPILQILIPFFAALLSTISFHKLTAQIIAIISAILGLSLSLYALPFVQSSIFYNFAGWDAPMGIEYRLDNLNQPIIILLNFVLLFFLVFGSELIEKTITDYIDNKRQHIFYSLLLFAHAGYLGVVSTNDLFNLYVFIEISSLATYVLMSKGRRASSLIGAFDYLMLGTIGATLILIGIGFLLAIAGSLNITDIANILGNSSFSRLTATAIAFFLSGAILKMAFFPMHFWMVRAYSSVAPLLLTYLAAVSGMIGVYVLLRFIYFVVGIEPIFATLTMILRPTAIMTILICTILSLRADDLKKIIIYSSASQTGYIFLIMTIWETQALLFQLLIFDALNKIALFTIIAHIQNKTDDLRFKHIKTITGNALFKTLVCLALIFSASLPLTSMFFVKVQLLDLLLKYNLIKEFVAVVFGSVFGLLYHLKFAKAIFYSHSSNGTIHINTNLYGLTAIVMMQITSLIYSKELTALLQSTEYSILGG
ncbi:MAG: proton-conducting transporter membrane subunit [Rickettsiaceae bacterium]|nr:proton-conducting transporter membrane subunit [Rickettsiaceae bacterium]